jgi:hypothetical protein
MSTQSGSDTSSGFVLVRVSSWIAFEKTITSTKPHEITNQTGRMGTHWHFLQKTDYAREVLTLSECVPGRERSGLFCYPPVPSPGTKESQTVVFKDAVWGETLIAAEHLQPTKKNALSPSSSK